ncbi:MAG TPA: extracellular solute-binding protein [Limnochordia bacterium]|nr:extracellular solute-binding protein [Limnochordia bacterium]
MAGKTEKITSGQAHAGQPCIFCQKPITAQDEVVVCPRCRSVQHAECWKSKGGCGRAGCPQLAQAVIGEKPKGDGPPPPISKKVIAGIILVAAALVLYIFFRPQPPDPAQGRVKIVVLAEASYALGEIMEQLAAEWNGSHGEVYIDLQLLPVGTLDPKLLVLIAAGDAPDVIALPHDRFPFFVEQGALMPLGCTESGEPIYGLQHPAQLSMLVVWGTTPHPEAAQAVLHYFLEGIPPADLDSLQERGTFPLPMFGF